MKTIYALGQKITITSCLKRRSRFVRDGDSPLRYEEKYWQETPLRNPIEGIIIGIRKLSNGRNHYIPEYGNDYEPKEHFKALIVAYHLSRKPILTNVQADKKQ